MSNPLLGGINNSGVQQNSNVSIVEAFREFKSNFKGDAQATINELLSSGKVTQEQVNQATLLAQLVRKKNKR